MLTVEDWVHKEKKERTRVSVDTNVHGQVITGMGAGREGVGTTRSLFHFATRLAETNPQLKICIADFNLSEPCFDRYFSQCSHKLLMHLDALYKQISDEITKPLVENNIILSKEQRNLFLLPGTRRPFSADSFSAEVLMDVLAALSHVFDVVVVDVSAHFDNPGTVAGLLSADQVLVFSNYDEDGLRLFNLYHSTLFSHIPDLNSRLHMVGVDNRDARTKELKHLTEIPLISELRYMKDFRFSFEQQQNELNGKFHDQYIQALDKMIRYFDLAGPEEQPPERRRSLWPFQRSSNSNV